MDAALASAARFQAPALFLYGGHDELMPNAGDGGDVARAARGPVRAFYPDGYHLMLRDLGRATPIERHPGVDARIREAPLPSGADVAAAAWLARQEGWGASPEAAFAVLPAAGTRSSVG